MNLLIPYVLFQGYDENGCDDYHDDDGGDCDDDDVNYAQF